MRYCLLMHYQEGSSVGLTEEDMAPAMAVFAAYADDLSAAGVLITTEVLDPVDATTTDGPERQPRDPRRPLRRHQGAARRHLRHRRAEPDDALKWAQANPANGWGSIEIRPVARTYAAARGWYNP